MSCISRPKQPLGWGSPCYRLHLNSLKYSLAIFWLSTKCRPTIDRALTNYWPIHRWSIDELSAKSRRSVGEVSVNEKLYRPRHIWNDYRTCLDRVSTDYRPLCRPTVDRVSTEYWPSIDRVSTECRPTIDRVSTAISTDISVDITHSKQDPSDLDFEKLCHWSCMSYIGWLITLDDPVLVVEREINVSSGIGTFLSRKELTFSGEDDC